MVLSQGKTYAREVRYRMTGETESAAPLNVLVVDDEPNIRKTLKMYLESHNHRVVAVSTFRDAVSAASRRQFDVALGRSPVGK